MNPTSTPWHLASTTRDTVGECPVWHVATQALFWVDIEGQRIHRLDWASRQQASWSVPERVGCIAMSTRGTVIAAMESGIFELALTDAPTAQVTRLATVAHPQANMRFNDGRCDAQGRFWAGTMVQDMRLASPAGGIYCFDENGLRGPLLQGYITPNGMAFSPEGNTAYLSDSHPTRLKIWQHSFNGTDGSWGPQVEWVNMAEHPGRPDGAAVDADGCYWICGIDAGQLHQFSPQGELLQSIALPMSKPTKCAFGGPELRHLFVTSLQPAAPTQGFDASLDGALLVLEPGVQGLPEPLFSRFPVR
ncbi:SMP-30/gluconolactonase/LRE family protein [Rhodoferax aquaticus]|uniref:SMP-30/gluconolactonase/LRE family protein n=1 Tax=Rhodoferax aquaticus TaxID=2527691 RepID=UPI0015ADA631|nr:SMP-30/gluconolactonase/LRE family protein [Rhodoferax aquaticus]